MHQQKFNKKVQFANGKIWYSNLQMVMHGAATTKSTVHESLHRPVVLQKVWNVIRRSSKLPLRVPSKNWNQLLRRSWHSVSTCIATTQNRSNFYSPWEGRSQRGRNPQEQRAKGKAGKREEGHSRERVTHCMASIRHHPNKR